MGSHRYVLGYGNPISYVDPDGRCSVSNESSVCPIRMNAARVGGENGAALSRMADAIQQQQRETAATQAAFMTGFAKQAGATAWGAVTLAADAVNAPIEGLTLGAYNVGATQRLQAQGQGMVEFAKAPIESTFEHFNQREQAIASAEAAGDTWAANEIRGRVGFDLAGMATGVAGTTRLLTRRVQGPKVTTHSGSDGAPIEQSTTVIVEGSDGGVVAASGAVPQVLQNKALGDAARDAIAASRPGSVIEQNFQVTGGLRRVDVLDGTTAIESKVGRTSLGSRERQELARDVKMLRSGQVESVEWHFSPSPITGKSGPTPKLRAKLEKFGIQIVE
jgi:hypothetical protein